MQHVNARKLASDAKFFESYSRWDEDEGRYETWNEAVHRVMTMHRNYYKDKMTDELSEMIDFAEEMYADKRFLGAQRALQFGGDQLLKHEMRMYNCFDRSTRFLTSVGIKSFNDFEDGDAVTVQTHTGAWKNALVKSYGRQQLYDVTFKNRRTTRNVKVTSDHRWILSDGDETTSLKVGDKLLSYVDDRFNSFDWDNATPEEQLYWCYGYVYGDGSTQEGYSKVRLCGKEVRFLYRFESFGGKTTSPHSLDGDVIVFTGQYTKTLPDIEQDGIEMCRAFIRGYLDADGGKDQGYWTENGNRFNYIYAKSIEAQQFIRDVFPACGVTINSEHVPGNITNFGINDGVRFGISTVKNDTRKWVVESIVPSHTDTVWCLEVEDDHSFVLEGGIVTGNCTSTYADRPAFFNELFYILLCGAGAGFSVQKHHIEKMPEIRDRKKSAKIFTVEDSIEGWSDAVAVLMSSFFVGGGTHPQYEGHRVYHDLSKIRPKNASISGGFKAPGPEPLRLALDKIEYLIQGAILAGQKRLRPIQVYDVAMHIADAVLAGGVRRSATICLFSPDDTEMLNAKTGDWFTTNKQRGRSNNSAVIVRSTCTWEMFKPIMEAIQQYGEPGFIFTDSTEFAYNPCVEIGMVPSLDGETGWQGCNLAEINGAKCDTPERLLESCRAASIVATLQAGYTNFTYLPELTKKIFDREALLGVSITGWMNNPNVLLNEDLLKEGAKVVRQTNEQVAAIIGINPAARTTCCKPAGNASVLLMTASGVHGEHSPLHFRVVQMNKDTEVAKLIREMDPYMVEESVWSANKTDYAIFFPVVSPEGSIYRRDLMGVDLLKNVKLIQQSWIEAGTNVELCVDPNIRHNVSNTVTVPTDGWDDVAKYLFDNKEYFCGVSFLADSGDKDYHQAPNTEVLTEQQIVDTYGAGAIFAAGLVTDAVAVFSNLWEAISIAKDSSKLMREDLDKQGDWIRRFHKFAANYFNNDVKKTEYCLKDVYLLHKWHKIQQNYVGITFEQLLGEKKYTDINTMGAAACVGNACAI